MGCGGASNARPVELPQKLTIHGSIVDSSTRSLMGMCKKSGQDFVFNKIDHVKGENTQSRYFNINPTGHIPMI